MTRPILGSPSGEEWMNQMGFTTLSVQEYQKWGGVTGVT